VKMEKGTYDKEYTGKGLGRTGAHGAIKRPWKYIRGIYLPRNYIRLFAYCVYFFIITQGVCINLRYRSKRFPIHGCPVR